MPDAIAGVVSSIWPGVDGRNAYVRIPGPPARDGKDSVITVFAVPDDVRAGAPVQVRRGPDGLGWELVV